MPLNCWVCSTLPPHIHTHTHTNTRVHSIVQTSPFLAAADCILRDRDLQYDMVSDEGEDYDSEDGEKEELEMELAHTHMLTHSLTH